jgi:hypothetical protein
VIVIAACCCFAGVLGLLVAYTNSERWIAVAVLALGVLAAAADRALPEKVEAAAKAGG